MEQIYSSMVNMLQFSAGTRPETKRVSEDAVPSEFEKLMNKAAEEQGDTREVSEGSVKAKETEAETEASNVENTDEEQEIDIGLMQELAAAQAVIFNSGTVNVAQAEASEAEINVPVVQSAQANEGQQIIPEAETAAEAVETVTENPVQSVAENAGAEQPMTDARSAEDNMVRAESVNESVDDNVLEYTADDSQVFKNVESAPIKVAEPTIKGQNAQPVTEAESVEVQVSTKISEAVENGETRIALQLEPANLGVVNIEITRSGDGAISVVLSADSKETQLLLNECSRGLENLLSNNGQQPVEITVQRHEEAQDGGARYGDLPDGRGEGQNGRQQERRQSSSGAEDFLHQLRLGLIPLEEAS